MTINTGWRRYFAPLNLAAYVTWLAVVAESWLSGARSAPLGTLPGRSVALALLGLFIGGFLLATADAALAPRGRAASGIALMLAAVAALLLEAAPTVWRMEPVKARVAIPSVIEAEDVPDSLPAAPDAALCEAPRPIEASAPPALSPARRL